MTFLPQRDLPMSHRIRVIVAEDLPLARVSTAFLLGTESDLAVIGEASDGHEAVELARRHQPDVVVLDYAMPGMNGAHAVREILAASPRSLVVVFSYIDSDAVIEAVRNAGAAAFIPKQLKIANLAAAIRKVISDPKLSEASEAG
jgi:DNA-binding NarL/FixJ family response regulator